MNHNPEVFCRDYDFVIHKYINRTCDSCRGIQRDPVEPDISVEPKRPPEHYLIHWKWFEKLVKQRRSREPADPKNESFMDFKERMKHRGMTAFECVIPWVKAGVNLTDR